MAFTNRDYAKQLSDLVVNEVDPKVGYARECINITAPAAGKAVRFGEVVFRAKSADPVAPYAVVTKAGDLALTNEYAVVLGDHYGIADEFIPTAAGNAVTGNAVAFVRGLLQLKEYYIKQVAQDAEGANLSDDDFAKLKGLLSKQDMIVEVTLNAQ